MKSLVWRAGLFLLTIGIVFCIGTQPAQPMPASQADELARQEVAALKDIARELNRINDTLKACRK